MKLWPAFKAELLLHLNPLHAQMLHWWMEKCGSRATGVSDRSAVVFAPHQDDETFGCGGMICLKRRMGIKVLVVFMTDGRGSAMAENINSREELIEIRRTEALAATAILGIEPPDVHFLEVPDTTLNALDTAGREMVMQKILRVIGNMPPAEIFVPHRKDIHPDHEATFELVTEALRQISGRHTVFEYAVWMTWLAKIGRSLAPVNLRGAYRLSVRSVLDVKKSAIHAYQSQARALPPHFIDRFLRPFEIFFLSSATASAADAKL